MKTQPTPKFLMKRINGERVVVPVSFNIDKCEMPAEWPVAKRMFDYYGICVNRVVDLRFGDLHYEWKASGDRGEGMLANSLHEMLFGSDVCRPLNDVIRDWATTSKRYACLASKLISFNSPEELDVKLAALGK